MVANGDIPLLCFFDDLREDTGRPITVGQMQAVDSQRRVFQCLQRRLSAIGVSSLPGRHGIGLFRHVHPNGEIFMLLLTLYTTSGCHLCEHAEAILDRVGIVFRRWILPTILV